MTSLEFSVRHVGGVKRVTCEEFTSVYYSCAKSVRNIPQYAGFLCSFKMTNLKRKDLSFCRVPKVIKNQGEEMEIL